MDRTELAESVALEVAGGQRLSEGKMLGVLLVRDRQGRLGYGRAFSGLLDGQATREGWVPPLHLPGPLPSEAATLQALADWKERLDKLAAQLEAHPYPGLLQSWQDRIEELRLRHRQSKRRRDEDRRASARSSQELEAESQADSRERKLLRQSQDAALADMKADYEAFQAAIQAGRSERRALSRALQEQMHQQFGETIGAFLGCPLDKLFPNGVPTGAGDCCAPKLLAWAARNELKPLALAELWWGPTSVGDKQVGEFYPACAERCQPLLGPMLALALREPVKVLYEDEHIVVADKPSGLLTVPGRYHWNQDCLLHRLQRGLLPVHRLDLETSGVVVLARHESAQADLRRQFAERSVGKVYQALLAQTPTPHQGQIDQPLARDPDQPGRYRISAQGKRTVTEYRVLDPAAGRIELRPLTGRSHQLRVHLASALGTPIRGDQLYGRGGESMKLHAWRLQFDHPSSGERLSFEAPLPF